MENAGELYFNQGILFFELKQYEQAVHAFIQAYELEYEKEKILNILYDCFIIPNEEEFKRNYEHNNLGFTRLAYEVCTIDFIPVSEEQFFVFNSKTKEFEGVFLLEKNPIHGENVEFDSILYTDIWDMRQIIPDLKETSWNTVYLLLNEMLEPQFASFFKLPRFSELYLENVIVFPDDRYMKIYFEEYNEFYLPKQIVTENKNKYCNMINIFHQKRITQLMPEHNNIFLSVCIIDLSDKNPAIQNVIQLLQCPYDSEIEFVILCRKTEEYKQIKDSRIRVWKLEKEQSCEQGIFKLLESAWGNFAVLINGCDIMLWKQLREYLNFIISHLTCGVFLESGYGEDAVILSNRIYEKGYEAVSAVAEINYLTGITYNMNLYRSICDFQEIREIKGNLSLAGHLHICIAMVMCMYSDYAVMKLPFWKRGGVESCIDNLRNTEQNNAFLDFRYLRILKEYAKIEAVYKKNRKKDELAHIYGLLCEALSSKQDFFQCLLLRNQYSSVCFLNGKKIAITENWNHAEYFIRTMQKMLKIEYKRIPVCERNSDFIVVAATQLLSERHAPSRIILEICKIIRKYLNKEVFLILEIKTSDIIKCMSMGFQCYETDYDERLTGEFTLQKKEVTYRGYQIMLNQENIQEMKQVMNYLYQKKPYCVWCFGGMPAFAGAMKQFTPMLYTQFSEGYPGIPADMVVNYFKRASELYKEDKQFLLKHHVIIRDINIGLKSYQKSEGKLKRDCFDIAENAFCIGIIGNRLQSDCTESFLDVLKQIVHIHTVKDIWLIFIGRTVEVFEKKVAEHVKCKERLRFLGRQEEFAEAVALIDLLAATPGLGNGGAGVAAMNEGKPVVCLKTGDIASCAGEDFQCDDISQYPAIIKRYVEDKAYYDMQSKKAENQFERLLIGDAEIAVQIKDVLEAVKGL